MKNERLPVSETWLLNDVSIVAGLPYAHHWKKFCSPCSELFLVLAYFLLFIIIS